MNDKRDSLTRAEASLVAPGERARRRPPIFTCFLEAIDEARVRVTDLVHESEGDGFTQRVGSYVKLPIPAARVDALLAEHGFTVELASVEGGLVTRIGRR